MGKTDPSKAYQQDLRLKCPESGRILIVRRITVELHRPTRNGETIIHLFTNVPKKHASALQLANLYRTRWTIETMFLELTETLTCEVKTLAYPKAAILAFCLAIPDENWTVFANLTPGQMAELLKQFAKHAVVPKHQKHRGGQKTPKPKRSKISKGNHVSTVRRLANIIRVD